MIDELKGKKVKIGVAFVRQFDDPMLTTKYYEGFIKTCAGFGGEYFVVFEDSENFNINDYNIYLYSENEPSETGKYWHYVNGVPTIWEIN